VGEEPDYDKYPAGLWGFTGVDPHQVFAMQGAAAYRSRLGDRGLYKAGLTQLPDGRLLAMPARSPSRPGDNTQWRHEVHLSADQGETWQHSADGPPGKEGSVASLSDGTLIHTCQTYDDAGGTASALFRSRDLGLTWERRPLEVDTMPHGILVENDTVRLFFSRGVRFTDRTEPSCTAWMQVSTDGGESWDCKDIIAWDEPEHFCEEISVIRLLGGRLLATFRVHNQMNGETPPPRGIPSPEGDETGNFMMIMESADDGIHWTEPRPLTNYSEVHGHLLLLADGRVMCTYSSYHAPYGVFAMFSEDQGRTWDSERRVMLANSLTSFCGWATSVKLPDGQLVTSYALTAYLEGERHAGARVGCPGLNDTAAEVIRWRA